MLSGSVGRVAEIGLGQAGLVVSLDVSRLARNSSDWHRLLELCGLFDTLIADGERLYDPRVRRAQTFPVLVRSNSWPGCWDHPA